jgi:hypothetical protein
MVEGSDADERALAGGYVAIPELGQVDAVEGEVGGTTRLARQAGSSKAEDLAGSEEEQEELMPGAGLTSDSSCWSV